MEPGDFSVTPNLSVARCALVVSAVVRFLRESLVEILGRALEMPRCEQAATIDDALELARSTPLRVILLDVAFPGGTRSAMRISAAAPDAKLIALWISETEEDVLAWAEAGIAGYVPNTASVDALIGLIGEISRGGQTCPSRIAGSLLRRVAASRTHPCADHAIVDQAGTWKSCAWWPLGFRTRTAPTNPAYLRVGEGVSEHVEHAYTRAGASQSKAGDFPQASSSTAIQ
jgi:DNA-binding NarL/FixJ family response regulator